MPTIHLVDDDLAVTDACQFLLESLGYAAQVWGMTANIFSIILTFISKGLCC